MALAALYAKAQSVNRHMLRPHGFIVDHKARPESAAEAEWVAEQLRWKCKDHRCKIKTLILITYSWLGLDHPPHHMA